MKDDSRVARAANDGRPATDKPHIVHLIRQATGGMRRHLLDLVQGLDVGGYRLTVVSPPNEILRTELKAVGVPFKEIHMADGLSLKDPLTVGRLAGLLRSQQPEILHIHGNKTALVGRPAALLAGVPAVVVTVHNFLVYQQSAWPIRAAATFMDRWTAGGANSIIAVSESLKTNLIEVERFKGEKITVIHNGIDIERWRRRTSRAALREKLGLAPDDFVVATVGRLVDWKGHDVLIKAAVELARVRPEARVVIAGDGPRRSLLRDLVAEKGLERNVLLLGYIPDTGTLLAAADLFVLPSLKEPFGIVLLEAMASGLPVIATEAGGVPEIIGDGCGVMVRPGDAAALGRAMVELASNGAERDRLSRAGAAAVRDRFSLKKMVAETEEVYAQCLVKK